MPPQWDCWCFIALAFGTLIYAFVTSDFSLQLVADNSHTLSR